MAKVFYEDPIEHLSGKISKNKQTIYNYRKGSKRKYTQVRSERLLEPTSIELEQRKKFKVVQAAMNYRTCNPNMRVKDSTQFRDERKGSPNFKYTTIRGWIFAKLYARFDELYNEETGFTQPETL